MKKIFSNKKFRSYFGYIFSFIIAILFILAFVQNSHVSDFLEAMENKTFDLRQVTLANSGYKKPSKDIVMLSIDDASYEYLQGKYGEWPIPRDVYANVIDYLEKQDPAVIAFDLMFVKSLKSKNNADIALVNSIKKNQNIYLSMNLDNQSFDVRKPVKLNDKFSVKVRNDSDINFNDVTFSNCRSILPQILDVTDNVGMINVSRSDDGILREIPPLMIYGGKFYPHLSFLVGMKYLNKTGHKNIKGFVIDKDNILRLGDREIPLNQDAGAILNWYGPAEKTFQKVPFYKVVKAINGEDDGKFNFDFKNKIVYIGTTSIGLYDVKSVPVDKLYPGVEVHATYVNNIIDNNFIKKVNFSVNMLISLALAIFVGMVVLRTNSTLVALGTTVLTSIGYVFLTYLMMKYLNLWFAVVLPITVVSLTFVAVYIIKYILKSRDFEHQYRLATTDGLTELYNHRYFQEQMIMQVANSKRYNSKFSLILIDIDFFKKFNDKYGHQSGDAVLKQVAKRLKRNVRATDFVCRYGGEEMTIILPNADRDEAIITAQKLCQVVSEKPCKLANNQESTVTISLGVSTFPEDGQTPNEIIEHADQRLYFAKENGRNQVGF